MFQLLKLIYPYIRPYLTMAVLSTLCALPIAAIKAYQAYFIKNVIDGIFDPDATTALAFQLGGILVGLGIINYPFRYYHFFGMRMVVDLASSDIRKTIYQKFQRLPAKYYANSKQGNLLSVMINDTAVFSEAFMHGLDIIREPLTAAMLLSVALYHDWKLTLIILAVLPLFMIIFTMTGKSIRKYVARAQQDTAEMTHHAAEGLTGQKIIKAFNLQKYMVQRFDKALHAFIQNKTRSNSAEEHSHPMVETVGALAFATIVVLAFYRSKAGLTVGEFISFIGALAMFMDPVRRYAKANTKLNQARAAALRIFNLLDEKEEEDQGTHMFQDFKDKIEFKNVTFSYGKGNVVENFNLTINKGQKVALVGLSGSGKSTLIALLLRLYPVNSGEITIDGININDYNLQSLRDGFALVSQDIFLFNDTIRENILAGQDFSEEQLHTALKVSYADEFVNQLPQKLETHIGDRGMKLSGGQSQRLTIARAFLRDCPVLLFDEATSALDNESEKTVQKAMEQVSGHKTVLAVAHRLSTIQSYDHIVVMKAGKKVEEGTHEQLLALDGEYKKLYELSLI